MSYLIGKSVLGNQFYQDPKPEWVKIDNVAVGEDPKYGYKADQSNDIGRLLDTYISDTNVVVVIYEWSTGKAYIKSGFNVSSSGVPTDVASKPGFTSFIVKSRAPALPNPTPTPTPNPAVPDFVSWNGTDFMLNGRKFVPVGFNAYWFGLTEEGNYPTFAQIEEMFLVAKQMSATVIRSHTLGFSYDKPKALLPFGTNTINNNAWEPIDYAFSMAKKHGIKLIVPLTDPYEYYHGSYGHFCQVRGVDKTQFWSHPGVRSDFKNYITSWLNHVNRFTGLAIKNDPAMCMIELGNELGNIRPNAGSTTIPTEDWMRDISRHIKSIDKVHLVLNGNDECLGKANDFAISTIDVHGAHFYWEDYGRMDYGINNCVAIRKPYVIGEYSPHFPQNWFTQIEKRAVKGSVFWGMYPHQNGFNGGAIVPHNDGFTLHYPENKDKLLILSNHFRRLRGLPQVSSI